MGPKLRKIYRKILTSYLEEMKVLYNDIRILNEAKETGVWLQIKKERYESAAHGARKMKELIKLTKHYG